MATINYIEKTYHYFQGKTTTRRNLQRRRTRNRPRRFMRS